MHRESAWFCVARLLDLQENTARTVQKNWPSPHTSTFCCEIRLASDIRHHVKARSSFTWSANNWHAICFVPHLININPLLLVESIIIGICVSELFNFILFSLFTGEAKIYIISFMIDNYIQMTLKSPLKNYILIHLISFFQNDMVWPLYGTYFIQSFSLGSSIKIFCDLLLNVFMIFKVNRVKKRICLLYLVKSYSPTFLEQKTSINN